MARVTQNHQASRTSTGMLFAVASALSFGLAGSLARGLLDTGWSAGAAVTLRVWTAALVLIVPGLMALRGQYGLLRRNAGLIIFYGLVAVAATQLCYFYAVTYLQVSVALLVEYTAPVPVVVWLWLRRGNRPGWLTLLGAAVAALGLVLVLDVIAGADVSVIGLLWSFGAMIGAAAYFLVSADQGNGLPGISLAAGGLTVAGVGLGIASVTGLLPFHASTGAATYVGFTLPWWGAVLALGLVTAALAYVTGIAAGRHLGSRLASFVALGEVLAAAWWAWLLLGEELRFIQLIGGALVLAGVVVVKLGEGRGDLMAEPLPAEPDQENLSERPAG